MMHLHMELEQFYRIEYIDGSEKPTGFVSRTLSKTEIKYPQIEKEGLSCVFGVKKFHSYRRPFTLITDHKPLLTLFNESRAVPLQTSRRPDTTLGLDLGSI